MKGPPRACNGPCGTAHGRAETGPGGRRDGENDSHSQEGGFRLTMLTLTALTEQRSLTKAFVGRSSARRARRTPQAAQPGPRNYKGIGRFLGFWENSGFSESWRCKVLGRQTGRKNDRSPLSGALFCANELSDKRFSAYCSPLGYSNSANSSSWDFPEAPVSPAAIFACSKGAAFAAASACILRHCNCPWGSSPNGMGNL